MDFVITLISNPQTPALKAAALRAACAEFSIAPEPDWLAPDIACDLPLLVPDTDQARETESRIREALAGLPVDVALQAAQGRRKRLLIADMDSTIIAQECIDEIGACLGLRDRIAAITERAMAGEIEFAPALRERVALLRGLKRRDLQMVLDERITLTPGARALVTTMARDGAVTALVSGGFTFFAEAVAKRAGFGEMRANELEFSGDELSGRVREPILGREAKSETLLTLSEKAGLTAADTMAVGDGANDLDMLARAGIGVAFHAGAKVAEAADIRIDHGDLGALLYVQGYRRGDFAAD